MNIKNQNYGGDVVPDILLNIQILVSLWMSMFICPISYDLFSSTFMDVMIVVCDMKYVSLFYHLHDFSIS